MLDALINAHVAPAGAEDLRAYCMAQLARHEDYIRANLEDLPEIRDWTLGSQVPAL